MRGQQRHAASGLEARQVVFRRPGGTRVTTAEMASAFQACVALPAEEWSLDRINKEGADD
jgi:hypothetical protein